jgi:hypothetical protein
VKNDIVSLVESLIPIALDAKPDDTAESAIEWNPTLTWTDEMFHQQRVVPLNMDPKSRQPHQ